MRVKICGITQPQQGQIIAHLGATALGFICVPQSPRYVTPQQIQAITAIIPDKIDKIGVFAHETLENITQIATQSGLTGVQLHGNESPEFCEKLRHLLPTIEIIKALRIKNTDSLTLVKDYYPVVSTLLLDAYDAQRLGGTGKTLNWEALTQFYPPISWFLAGGLTPDNICHALSILKPNGIDLSSGVEKLPGNKDLEKVAQLMKNLGFKAT